MRDFPLLDPDQQSCVPKPKLLCQPLKGEGRKGGREEGRKEGRKKGRKEERKEGRKERKQKKKSNFGAY